MADPYLDTVSRLEPDIAMIDAGAGYASIAISLKRIADEVQKQREAKEAGNIALGEYMAKMNAANVKEKIVYIDRPKKRKWWKP